MPAPVLYSVSMSEQLGQLVREALEAGIASLRTLSEESGLHYVTLTRWRTGAINASPASAQRFARALRERAVRMLDLASRVEALAQLEGGQR